jgi:4'-phosphopantetheinyl transferase
VASLTDQTSALPAELDVSPPYIHVVEVHLDLPFPGAAGVLDADERARAARFAFDRDSRRFIHAHAYLRVVLGSALGRSPRLVRLSTRELVKPRLTDVSSDLRFNMSHSGERALIAVACGREVGIDIEQERGIRCLELASRFFSPGEIDGLRRLPPPDQTAAFFRCWTARKPSSRRMATGSRFHSIMKL